MASPLSSQDIADLAVYLHGLHGGGGEGLPPPEAAQLARGRSIWLDGIPSRAAACASCHGRQAQGAVMRSPEIAGEPRPYLVAQLQVMRDHGRAGTPAARVMSEQAQKLNDAEIGDVAAFVASLPPASTRHENATP